MASGIWVNIDSGNGLLPWRHQAITWTNVDLSSVRSSDIHLRVVSQKIPQPSVTKFSFKIAYLKFHSNCPGANELKLITMINTLWHEWYFVVAASESARSLAGVKTLQQASHGVNGRGDCCHGKNAEHTIVDVSNWCSNGCWAKTVTTPEDPLC